ncbi:uncharacterized protein LOC120130342 [Hibiscus syriacus]|uniref:uncharacterized protein LOC120130342 n=1 Tax=Hibiscus syriacus TaxID=106335 RepID=UPI001921CA6C|nr:uncharacterized protein LOC120130342 [Hibiscus syriacus]
MSSKPVLAEWISAMDSELNQTSITLENPSTEIQGSKDGDGDMVQWRANTMFEQELGTLISIDIFKLLMKSKRSDVVAILEPRISGIDVDQFIKNSDFEFSYRVEASGFSGGIWILWKNSFHITILAVSRQYIHVACSMMDGEKQCFITFVYASPAIGIRNRLWRHLKELDPVLGLSWLLGGDFNVISNYGERQGGSQWRHGVCAKFGEFMFDTGLIDMGFSGPKFTWKRRTLSQRLDRCICNAEWYHYFENSDVFHLQKLGSDHRPILLKFGEQQEASHNRPFRYIDAWSDHQDFQNLLMNSWKNDRDLYENILEFQAQSTKWNKEVFGHIGRRKNLLLARIHEVEKAVDNSNDHALLDLETRLKKKLNVVLAQEESL